MTKDYSTKPGEDEAHFVFKVANLSAKEVVINRVQGTCGCTYPKMPAQPWRLRAGETGELPVTMKLAGKPPGEVVKELTVYSSIGERKLTVKTIVPAPVAVKTAALVK